MGSYKIVDNGETSIGHVGEGELKPIYDGVGEYSPDEKSRPSKIIEDMKDIFGTDFTDDDKVFLKRVKDNLLENEELLNNSTC